MGHTKGNSKGSKPPSYFVEFAFVSMNLFFLKMYSENSYFATSFFSVLVPMMAYSVISLFGNLLKFIQLMHIEDASTSILSPKQLRLLLKVLMNLMTYFGLYFLSAQMDLHLKTSDNFNKIAIGSAMIGLELAFAAQIYLNHQTRKDILSRTKQEDIESGVGASLFSTTGLTTIFNAMTQTTTTLCANGQCFTIYSNTIASNLAAFGVSMTAVTTYLVPLCMLLLSYSVWTLYRERRECMYKPFLLGLTGAVLIVLDNFIIGETLNLQNIPSWAGNAMLIIGTIWAGRDKSKETSTAFGAWNE